MYLYSCGDVLAVECWGAPQHSTASTSLHEYRYI